MKSMKQSTRAVLLYTTILALITFACSEDEMPVTASDPLSFDDPAVIDTPTNRASTSQGLAMSLFSSRDRLHSLGLGGPTGFLFTLSTASNGRTLGGPFSASRGINSSSNARTLDGPGICFQETFSEFTDGSYEFILDFGEGCETEGEFFKGKMIERGSYTETTFEGSVEYIGFGGSDWTVDGTETYSGTWTGDEDSEDWSVEFDFQASLTETYTEDFDGQSETITVVTEISGKEKEDGNSFTILEANESSTVTFGSDSGSETYQSTVTSPIVENYACDEQGVYVPVSGTVAATYEITEGDSTYTEDIRIDYGDGTCDNLAEISINGETESLDLFEEFEDEWEEEWEDDEDEEGEEDEEDEDFEDLDIQFVEELVYDETCNEYVDGLVEIYYGEELVATVDLGDGTCDGEVTICEADENGELVCETVSSEEFEELLDELEDGDEFDDYYEDLDIRFAQDLVFDETCGEYVSGVIEVYEGEELIATADLGDGTCDGEVTVCEVIDGESVCETITAAEFEEFMEDLEDYDEDFEEYEITFSQELVMSNDCNEYVSGVVDVYEANELVFQIDLGDGTCDNEITLCETDENGQTFCETLPYEEFEYFLEEMEEEAEDDEEDGEDEEGEDEDEEEGEEDDAEDEDEDGEDEEDEEGEDAEDEDEEGDEDEDEDGEDEDGEDEDEEDEDETGDGTNG